MPRNRYTRFVRKLELRRLASQEKELAAIARRLRNPDVEPAVEPMGSSDKERRAARLAQNRRHRPQRAASGADVEQPVDQHQPERGAGSSVAEAPGPSDVEVA